MEMKPIFCRLQDKTLFWGVMELRETYNTLSTGHGAKGKETHLCCEGRGPIFCVAKPRETFPGKLCVYHTDLYFVTRLMENKSIFLEPLAEGTTSITY